MAVNRRQFLTVAGAGAAAWATACREKAPEQAPGKAPEKTANVRFTMNVRDGYAYVFKGKKSDTLFESLVIGAIDAADHTTHKPIPHPLRVALQPGKGAFDLTGWHVELDLGIDSGGLTVPAETWPATMACPTTLDGWNNRAWLAPAAKVFPGVPVRPDWAGQLSSRLVVRQGTLSVLESAGVGLWKFKNAVGGGTDWEQPLSDNTRVEASIPANRPVTLRFYPIASALPNPGDPPKATVTLDPGSDGLNLEVTNGLADSPPYKIGEAVRHFTRYGNLMDQGQLKIVIPHFYPCGDGQGESPGIFCPYVSYEV